MSRCDIDIIFDNPDRTYRGGDVVSGEVLIDVNKDTRCNGILLTHFWRTHGRGNVDGGDHHEIPLQSAGELRAGETLRLPFRFTAELWPLTWHGHHINVDHFVKVAVDVPWAIDPKHEEEFILQAGRRPPEVTGDRSVMVSFEAASRQATEVHGILKWFLIAVVLMMISALAVFALFLVPIILIVAGGVWAWRKAIASRVGHVALQLPCVVVAPGEKIPVELSFTPQKSFPINGITAKVIAQESATSGSGTNKSTHHHVLHEVVHQLRPAGQLTGGERVTEYAEIPLPDLQAWSLKASSNVLTWRIETRIDIPRFPDWKNSTPLQMLPVEFLDDIPTTTADHAANNAPARSTPAGQNTGSDLTPLLTLAEQIREAGRFGKERDNLIASAAGTTFLVDVEIDRVFSTFGFSGSSRAHRNGKTLAGKLAGTDQDIQLFAVERHNESTGRLTRGDHWQARVTVEDWDSLHDRLVLHEHEAQGSF